ncbi:D-ribose pyranase [Alkalibacter mobilis]|uniref:D-ribose pyranase n=1 Tax=Alkalibacter mobilis TaxID=2787712 RepID=UPI00189EBDF7|nr:D-ribose pyranase [Alkalibacter mobilis]MBF7095576.1 D-ribose pyranase [Alkalibacter mobilis]
MKKSYLLNSNISSLISRMGHKDNLAICDAGLPIPEWVERIDLAVSKGVPQFLDVLKGVLSEQKVEEVIMAEEIKENSITLHDEILRLLGELEPEVEIRYVTHEEFKKMTEGSMAVIRTGEFTPYANVILVSGVVF